MSRVAEIVGYAWLGTLALFTATIAVLELHRILTGRSRSREEWGEDAVVCELRRHNVAPPAHPRARR